MANTYTQIHIHAVIVVKYRAAMIHPVWKDQLHKYITGILQNRTHKMIAINSMPDHLHLFFGLRPIQSLSDLMRDVKAESSEWINKEKLTAGCFRWQAGFGAFSYARSQVSTVSAYVENQEKHHSRNTFIGEYKQMLEEFEVNYDGRYIFVKPK